MGMAYRKAKVDLYYMGNPCLLQLQEYEENLQKNLESLYEKIVESEGEWFSNNEFLGEWSLIPKSITDLKDNGGAVFSSPEDKWHHLCKDQKAKAEFRLIAKPSIDFLIYSTLWMIKVGHKYDEKLSECAYGSRLRRTQEGDLNLLALGSFAPYQKPFRDWRDNGINIMRSALDKKESIVAITADVSSFYHELNPDFLVNNAFLKLIDLELDDEDKGFTNQLIAILKKWAKQTPLKKGLPVGLPVSALVANVALIELDQLIQQEVVPLYYGRYVDDLILVMSNNSNFDSTEQVWNWIFARTKKRLSWDNKTEEERKTSVLFKPDYLHDSRICFANEKNKLFFLEGDSGAVLIDSLSRQILERASEWRALPCLPENPKHIATDIIAASQNEEDVADNLRKADSLSMRRSHFAIKVRDFEAYGRDLPPASWQQSRKVFLDVFTQNTVALPIFFDMAKYLPRVICLATACEGFDELKEIVNRINKLIILLSDGCEISIKSCDNEGCPEPAALIDIWKKQITQIIDESIKSSFPTRLTREGTRRWEDNFADFTVLGFPRDIKENQAWQSKLFSHDLAHTPFRYIGLPRELSSGRGITTKKSLRYCQYTDLLEDSVWSGLAALGKRIKCHKASELPYGLVFATRPFDMTELCLLHNDPYKDESSKEIANSILALRGFSVKGKMPTQRGNLLELNTDVDKSNVNIAVASWKTDIRSWTASVTKSKDPDESRYYRINLLLNSVMQSPVNIDYLILPELSIPAHWFFGFAKKLHGRGIVLIAGVEYLHRKNKKVTNQIWAALSHDGLGFPSILIHQQDKQTPALHEERELQRLAGVQMSAVKSWKTPPIIRHGNFQFALLVCSELTNIAYRTALRGKVDALLVPEWNQDTDTFNALVESAALDVHAYIIQCNDRQYGDSRIRAPYKDSWRRDIVRLKGGEHDYFAVGKIDVSALRRFQSSFRSASSPFKPLPDGFEYSMAYERKMLPEAE